jgi:hypothetical protein
MRRALDVASWAVLALVLASAIIDAITGDWSLLAAFLVEAAGLTVLAVIDLRYGLSRRVKGWSFVGIGALAVATMVAVSLAQG